MKRIFNPGSGFVDSYDYTFSGLSVVKGCLFGCLYCYSPTIIRMELQDFQKGGKEPRLSLEEWQLLVDRDISLLDGKTLYANVMNDPYQPTMRPYTHILWESLAATIIQPAKIVIQTRSPQVSQDIDLLQKFNTRVNFTIETNDESVRKSFSPNAPGLEARWKALEAISAAGIDVCITSTPTLPFLPYKAKVQEFCERANALKRLTHVVVQEFHSGALTNTAPEGKDVKERAEYDWYFARGKGYQQLSQLLTQFLRVPVMDGKPGFAPYAPKG